MISALAAALQLLAPPSGLPAPMLRLIHVDARAAVHVDVSDQTAAGRLALITSFDTRIEPYWLWVEFDCPTGTARTAWRQTAVELIGGERQTLSGAVPQPLADPGAGPAVARQVCLNDTLFPETAPTTDADAAMAEAYDLPALVRERPDLYARTGDLGETVEFIGLSGDDFGWFVDPRTAHEVDGGAEIQTLRIAGRGPAETEGARYVWSRMWFSCETASGRIVNAFAYDDRHQPVGTPDPPADLPAFAPNSPLDVSRGFACTPGSPPDSQTVQGLESALTGIRDHFAPGGPADRSR